MGHPHYKNCKECGRHESEVGALSWTRLCGACGPARLLANADAMVARDGPEWEHYLMRSLLATHARLIAIQRDRLPDDG